jgi:hypothetical protein
MRVKGAVVVLLLVGTLGLGGCDDDDESSDALTSSEAREAAVTTTGDGLLVVHPSADPTWGWALAAPVRIAEHNGGSADWNWARLSVYQDGLEVERAEIGADGINEAGLSGIGANSEATYNLVFRLNTNTFDFFILQLNFTDRMDGSAVPSSAPFETFDGVGLSLTPLSQPADEVEHLPAGQ